MNLLSTQFEKALLAIDTCHHFSHNINTTKAGKMEPSFAFLNQKKNLNLIEYVNTSHQF